MKWINCDEAMPERYEAVLVWVLFEGNKIGTFDESWIDEKGEWAMGSEQNFKVTHWMRIEDPTH